MKQNEFLSYQNILGMKEGEVMGMQNFIFLRGWEVFLSKKNTFFWYLASARSARALTRIAKAVSKKPCHTSLQCVKPSVRVDPLPSWLKSHHDNFKCR